MTIKNYLPVFASLLVLSLVLCGCSGQGERSQTAKSATEMDLWANNQLAAWNSHDAEKILSFYSDDCIYEDLVVGKVNHGKEELRAFITDLFTGSPDIRMEKKSFFASGDHVCMEWIMSGTHSGNWTGMPATGKSFSVRGVSVSEIRDGKVKQNTDYYDGAPLMRQLGLLPPAMAADPEIGTWKMNPSKTKVTGPAGPQEKSSSVKIEPTGDSIRLSWNAVTAEGKAYHGEFVAKYDGKDYPVIGYAAVDMVSQKKIDPNTIEYVWKKAGKEVLAERGVISKDGKKLTLTGKGKDTKGQDFTVVTVWEKQ